MLLYVFPEGQQFTVRYPDLADFHTTAVIRIYIAVYGRPVIQEAPPPCLRAPRSIRVVVKTLQQLVANRIAVPLSEPSLFIQEVDFVLSETRAAGVERGNYVASAT